MYKPVLLCSKFVSNDNQSKLPIIPEFLSPVSMATTSWSVYKSNLLTFDKIAETKPKW
jgi:hypothetical protein